MRLTHTLIVLGLAGLSLSHATSTLMTGTSSKILDEKCKDEVAMVDKKMQDCKWANWKSDKNGAPTTEVDDSEVDIEQDLQTQRPTRRGRGRGRKTLAQTSCRDPSHDKCHGHGHSGHSGHSGHGHGHGHSHSHSKHKCHGHGHSHSHSSHSGHSGHSGHNSPSHDKCNKNPKKCVKKAIKKIKKLLKKIKKQLEKMKKCVCKSSTCPTCRRQSKLQNTREILRRSLAQLDATQGDTVAKPGAIAGDVQADEAKQADELTGTVGEIKKEEKKAENAAAAQENGQQNGENPAEQALGFLTEAAGQQTAEAAQGASVIGGSLNSEVPVGMAEMGQEQRNAEKNIQQEGQVVKAFEHAVNVVVNNNASAPPKSRRLANQWKW